ncbi:MAG TPA: chromate transporter [Xanthobacteraceae bacterium]|nr:chromate transporter [Xanthobacteraceae bacterium]
MVALLFVFAPLSLVSIGGGPAVFAEMQHQAVTVHGWVTQRQFVDLFAISRAAPGPGALLATLIGWQAAGWLGALVVSFAFFLPSSIVVYVVACFWNRLRGSAWHRAVEDGFVPIAAGLVLAGALAILQSGGTDPLAGVIALGVAAYRLWRPNFHPLILLGLGASLFALVRAIV